MAQWETYAKCKCGAYRYASHGSLFHATIHGKVCFKCGRDIENGKIVVARYVSDVQFLKPSTWWTGHWEEKDGDE